MRAASSDRPTGRAPWSSTRAADGIRNTDGSGGARPTDVASTSKTGSRAGSSGRPNRSAQASRSRPAAGKTCQRSGNQLVWSSQIRTRSFAKNGRQSPPSDRNGNSDSARSNGTSTTTAGRSRTVSCPITVTAAGSASAVSGSTRSVGAGAAEEKGMRLRTEVTRCGQLAVGHGAGPDAYQSPRSTISRRSVGVAGEA